MHTDARAHTQHIIYINVIPALYYMHLGLVFSLTNSYPLYFLDRESIDTGISNRIFVTRKNHILQFSNPRLYFFVFISILIIRLINASQCAHALISSANRHDLLILQRYLHIYMQQWSSFTMFEYYLIITYSAS